jgi:PAS domain S-box-containing protein
LEFDPERWLAAIVESSDDAIVGESLDGTITSWNKGAERIFGYTAEEAIGRTVKDLAWPGAEEHIEMLLGKLSHGERVQHFETLRKHKSGRKILVSLSLSPIVGDDGRVIGIAKIARDVTERTALQESLTQRTDQVRRLIEREAHARAEALAERRFHELIENAPDAIVQMDENGTIAIANKATEMLFGYDHDELIGSGFGLLVPEGQHDAQEEDRTSFVQVGGSWRMGQESDLRALRKDGTEFPVEISLSSITMERGVQVTAVIRDVTERRRSQEEVRRLQESYMAELQSRREEAERLNRVKSEFLAALAHELRTPLHTIGGFAELLNEEMEGTLTKAQKEFVQHIRQDSQHLLQLIDDVLDFSRIEAGGMQVRTEPLPLRDAMAEAVSAIQPHAEAKGVALQTSDPGDALVMADPMRLRQIFYNLLSSAVKFTATGGEVSVTATSEGGLIRVTVADTGIGISPDEQSMIFKKFYQVGYTPGGAGLGLAICKQLVEMQGGSISVESEVNRGTQFHFNLVKASAVTQVTG